MYIQEHHTHATPDWPGPNTNWTHTIYAINPLFRGVPERGNCCCMQKRKSEISASAWGAQHPNTGQNIQQ